MSGRLLRPAPAAFANPAETGAAPPSRSADIHHWIASAAPALGLTPADVNSALSADPLIRAITALLHEDGSWTGTATALHAILERNAVPGLPAAPRALTQRLHATPLCIFGIHLAHQVNHENRLLNLSATQSNFAASQDPEFCVAD